MQSIRLCACLWNDRRGVTAIEYALMAGAIAVVLVTAMASLNSGISTAFKTAANAFPTK